jgi:hypothetical protein
LRDVVQALCDRVQRFHAVSKFRLIRDGHCVHRQFALNIAQAVARIPMVLGLLHRRKNLIECRDDPGRQRRENAWPKRDIGLERGCRRREDGRRERAPPQMIAHAFVGYIRAIVGVSVSLRFQPVAFGDVEQRDLLLLGQRHQLLPARARSVNPFTAR